ncbi:MAG: uracil-DNA glycosylase [Myxococcales bacterium]|nr:uracil-DNA glycosylase [Myxococcales bacterium]
MTDAVAEKTGPQIHPSWLAVLGDQFKMPYMAALKAFLLEEKKKHKVYPPGPLMFNAFNLTPFDKVRVVIIGQDPYHGPGQAHGLSFSVPDGVPPPPSLVNIFQEIETDLGLPAPSHGNLTYWAEQGVLLLNAVLSVRARKASSHAGQGWETFTDRAIEVINEGREGVAFALWGKYAREKASRVDRRKHLVLTSAHPSPYSAASGFFGCHHFSKINQFLTERGESPIDWSLPPR